MEFDKFAGTHERGAILTGVTCRTGEGTKALGAKWGGGRSAMAALTVAVPHSFAITLPTMAPSTFSRVAWNRTP